MRARSTAVTHVFTGRSRRPVRVSRRSQRDAREASSLGRRFCQTGVVLGPTALGFIPRKPLAAPTPGGHASTGLGWCPLGAQGPCPLGAARSAGPPGTSEVSSSQLLRGRAGVQQDGGRREAAGAQGPQRDGAGRRRGARAGPALGRVSQNAGPAATKTDGGSAPAACCTDPRAPDESEQHRTLCWLLGPPPRPRPPPRTATPPNSRLRLRGRAAPRR